MDTKYCVIQTNQVGIPTSCLLFPTQILAVNCAKRIASENGREIEINNRYIGCHYEDDDYDYSGVWVIKVEE